MIEVRERVDGGTYAGCEFAVRVIPGAGRDAVAGELEGALKVRVAAPPVDGAANDRLVRFLAREILGVRQSAVTIVRGVRGRRKTVNVAAPADVVRAALVRAVEGTGGVG